MVLDIAGVGNSLQFPTVNTLPVAALRTGQKRAGTSLLVVNQQQATGFGIAIGALLLKTLSLPAVSHGDLYIAFRYTFAAVGLITFTSSAVFARLHSQDGERLLEGNSHPGK